MYKSLYKNVIKTLINHREVIGFFIVLHIMKKVSYVFNKLYTSIHITFSKLIREICRVFYIFYTFTLLHSSNNSNN